MERQPAQQPLPLSRQARMSPWLAIKLVLLAGLVAIVTGIWGEIPEPRQG